MLHQEQYWRPCLQAHAQRKGLSPVETTLTQAANTAKAHFKQQSTDTAVHLTYQRL
jgi:hypothetical protein